MEKVSMVKEMLLWDVKHPEHEEVRVTAPDRLNAIVGAARIWGVPWTSVGRECETKKIGPAPAEKAQPAKKKKPTSAKGAHHGD